MCVFLLFYTAHLNLQAKLCCSLRWLATLIPPRQLEEQVDSDGGKGVTVKQLLLSPYQRNSLREGVVKVLTTPSLYVSAHGSIVTDEILECGNNSFWPLIQSLAKRGIYILDEDEAVVNHTILSQRSPFKQVGLQSPSPKYVTNWIACCNYLGKPFGPIGFFDDTVFLHYRNC